MARQFFGGGSAARSFSSESFNCGSRASIWSMNRFGSGRAELLNERQRLQTGLFHPESGPPFHRRADFSRSRCQTRRDNCRSAASQHGGLVGAGQAEPPPFFPARPRCRFAPGCAAKHRPAVRVQQPARRRWSPRRNWPVASRSRRFCTTRARRVRWSGFNLDDLDEHIGRRRKIGQRIVGVRSNPSASARCRGRRRPAAANPAGSWCPPPAC